MKNSIRFFATLIMLAFCLIASAQNATVKAKKLWSLAEVKAMAKKYHLEDSVTLPKNEFLVYLSKKSLDNHFKREAEVAKKNFDWSEYLSKTKYIHTFEEDAKLMESYPAVRKAIVEMRGGEQAHQAYVAAAKKYQWRIYRDNTGGLAFFRADLPVNEREFHYGKRIDTLPKE
jgi:hypothetical protein